MEIAEQTVSTLNLPISQIEVQADFNPRRFFNDDALNELTESVRTQGVLQSILVRPTGEGARYYLVAGERRFRAAQRAGLTSIPAQVRQMTDEAALAAATAENGAREDISVAEEARLAKRAVSLSEGDRDEAAKLLGWKRSRVDARLMLLHACDEVLDALERSQIKIGHAELLSTLPKATQQGTLEKIIADEISVADLKGKIGQFTRELARARFDTSACQGCPFNSSTQASLFDFSVGAGRCSNHECWTQKNIDHVAKVVTEQRINFPAVHTDAERDETGRVMLFENGTTGVGPDQFAACKSCEFYGALVSTEPGREGAVTEGVCFKTACNKKKIAAFAKAQKEAAAEAQPKATGTDSSTSTPSATAAAQTTPAAPSKPKPKDTAGTPKAVTERADAFVREQAIREQKADTTISSALAVFGLFQMADTVSQGTIRELMVEFTGDKNTTTATSSKLYAGLLAATPQRRDLARMALLAHLLGEHTSAMSHHVNWQNMAKATVAHRQPDLTQTFKLDEAYLRAHTKSGMEALLREAGFDKWYDAQTGHNKGAFAKLMKAKVDQIVAKVLPESGGFDFTGFVPASVYQQAGFTPNPAA
ncbi:PRTRC system ParB family protein [Salinisphaera sp. T31B1]|uniref:PRTRC system ParB family protein n=1 Tax=Salinisphaera sp. T31B1 TaxID=727963 RepID=UPI00333F1962